MTFSPGRETSLYFHGEFFFVQGSARVDVGWCPFCGGRLKPTTKIKEITYEGKELNIHKNEYREFQETGLLKYLEAPRSGPFSQDFVDLAIIFSVSVGVGLFFIWMITSVGL